MKARNILIAVAGTLLMSLYFASCGEDRWKAYAEETATDRWIDDTMRVWYYWADEMPNTNKLNYFQAPFTFFSSLLSKEDKFSYIDSLTSTATTTETRSIPYTDYSYGFQFATARMTIGEESGTVALVLYVADGTPAAEVGLQRGDWILKVDGEMLTDKTVETLYGGPSAELTVGYYDAEANGLEPYETPLRIASARPIEDNPVHYYSILTSGTKRVGYLVYNHFTAGATTGSYEYNSQLLSLFQQFAAQQVNEFVLDLRYNNGGLVSCAELLCTLLAPASALGQPLGYLEFNAKHKPQQITELTLNPEYSAANLNLSTLYVLTGSLTASASELVINCLAPYMNVVLIGTNTVGKNMGAVTFDNPELMVTMSPLVCKIYNSLGESEYSAGFTPQYSVNETGDLSRFLPFGDPDEALLNVALNVILGNYGTEEEEGTEDEGEGTEGETGTEEGKLRFTPITYSIERRATAPIISR